MANLSSSFHTKENEEVMKMDEEKMKEFYQRFGTNFERLHPDLEKQALESLFSARGARISLQTELSNDFLICKFKNNTDLSKASHIIESLLKRCELVVDGENSHQSSPTLVKEQDTNTLKINSSRWDIFKHISPEFYLSKNTFDISKEINSKNDTLLHAASESGDVHLVKYLLSKGADIYQTNAMGRNAMIVPVLALSWHEISEKQKSVITTLLSRDPKIFEVKEKIDNDKKTFVNTPLHWCIGNEGYDASAWLTYIANVESLKNGKKLNFDVRDNFGKTSLHFAVITGAVKLVSNLIAAGADVNAMTSGLSSKSKWHDHYLKNKSFPIENSKVTPLHLACLRGDPELVRILLAAGANPKMKDIHGKTPMDYAHSTKSDIVNMLTNVAIDAHRDKNSNRDRNDSMLKLAINHNGSVDEVNLLIKRNGDLNQIDNDGKSLLSLALMYSRFDLLNVLLENGSNPNTMDNYGSSIFHEAYKYGDPETVGVFLKNGVNPNIVDSEGRSILHYACAMGDFDSIKLLVEKGSNPNITYIAGSTPLKYAKAFMKERIYSKDNIKIYNILRSKTDPSKYIDGKQIYTEQDKIATEINKDKEIDKNKEKNKVPLWKHCKDGQMDIVRILQYNPKGKNVPLDALPRHFTM